MFLIIPADIEKIKHNCANFIYFLQITLDIKNKEHTFLVVEYKLTKCLVSLNYKNESKICIFATGCFIAKVFSSNL
jgi:hypothetical protein